MPDETGEISTAQMDAFVRAGTATALLPAFDVGPTRYADRWWHVPHGNPGYVIAGPDDAARYAEIGERATRLEALAARHLADWRVGTAG